MSQQLERAPAWVTEGYDADYVGRQIAENRWRAPHSTPFERAMARASTRLRLNACALDNTPNLIPEAVALIEHMKRPVHYCAGGCGLAFSTPTTCYWCARRSPDA